MYGPTETTIWSTARKLRPSDAHVAIGRPVANTRLYVVDAQLNPVPFGVPGELLIAGDGVARGYLNQPELTQQKFIRDHFGPPDTRMYRTGDLVRYRADGDLEYLGRLDEQVKIRGFRIEPGEIETRLAKHEHVGAAIVQASTDGDGTPHLAAYVTLRPDSEANASEIAAQLRTWVALELPEFMVPSYVTVMDAWPLTPNGKIDRRALPPPAARVVQSEYAAPLTLTAQRLARIWADLLQLDVNGISAESRFFAIGGHSLLLVRLLARIEHVFHVRIDVRTAYAVDTIAHLASLIDDILALRQPSERPASTAGVMIELEV
jgi:acyl carrier protein